MDCTKIGRLICSLRRENRLTQRQLADRLNISDKAVSKWERGLGCPDVSLLPELAALLGVQLDELLSGELSVNTFTGGNMKRLKFYVCPQCGNLLTAAEDAAISCCGRKLQPVQPVKAAKDAQLSVEIVENDYFITTPHEMTKTHYISFAALLTGDTLILRKLYPEWDMQTRLPRIGHGMLLWYCTQHGLFFQLV